MELSKEKVGETEEVSLLEIYHFNINKSDLDKEKKREFDQEKRIPESDVISLSKDIIKSHFIDYDEGIEDDNLYVSIIDCGICSEDGVEGYALIAVID